MNSTRQTNTFGSGMNMDVDYSVIKPNQYAYAENIRVVTNGDATFGAMQNIEGFLKCNASMQMSGETIIHTKTIRDIAIVITKIKDSDNFNVYKYDFSLSETEPKVVKVVDTKPLGIVKSSSGVYAVSSVLRWEGDENIKLYWTDGHSQTKVINVDDAHISENANITADNIGIVPKAVLPPFEFDGFGVGSLTAGMVQYCYQLFNSRGTSTAISQLTPLWHLTADDDKSNSREVLGSKQGDNTGKSVKLKVDNTNSRFNRARIISINYENNTSAPKIYIVDDIAITGNIIQYEDKGSGRISELSIDEFNAMTGYMFIPEVIESKDNRLFAANITEVTWDVDYDARAYRADETGQVKLLSNSQQAITFALNNVATTDIPEDFDCICPYNVNEGNYKYTYNTKGELIQGGKGKNISYRFITTDLIEDGSIVDSRREAIYNEEFTFNTVAYNFNSLTLNYEGDDKTDSIPLTSGPKIFNYSNSEIAGKARGYQRDEIYRFGIVFYNSYGLNSSVHWIGDIRMPSSHDEGYEIFQSGGTTPFNAEYALITKPLGIEFEVNNLPKDAVRYEIVRCERTANDRTIVAQGAVSCLTNFDSSSSSLVPFPYMAYSTKHGYFGAVSGKIASMVAWIYSYDFPLSENQSNNYFIFASPEICINQENSSQIIDKFEDIELLCYLTSPIRNSIETSFNEFPTDFNRFAGNKKVFANATAFKANGTEIVPITESDMQRVNGFLGVFEDGPESSTKEPLVSRQTIVINGDGWYSALLAKYYMKTTPSEKHVAKVDDSALSIQCDPIWSENEGFTDKGGVAVGEKVYYNWVFESKTTDVDEDANNVRKFGPHGICAVFKSDNMLENIPLLDSEANPYRTNGVALCNMKRTIIPYGGNSYTSIQNSTYVQTGVGGETAGTIKCFGGDTFIGILDYANMMLHFKADDKDKGTSNRCFIGAFIPCESTANLSLTHNPAMLHKSYDPSNGYANHFEQNDIVTYGEVYSQNMPLYAYNDAYSTEPTAKTFVSKSMYNLDNLTTDVRIMASEQKTNNEVYDSWTQFKVANYLDVDTRFGSINDMVLFKNKLLFWQTDAFGTASVNERSIITDNNPGELTLGTGGVLDRYDYFTTHNGKSDNHLRAHTQTDNTVYWFDAKRNEICGFDGNIQAVSKLKGVQSYLNENKGTFLPDPIAVYDKKYNEVLFTLKDNTLAFNEQISAFTSFYTYKPDYYAEFSDKLYVFKDLNLFKYNSGDTMDLYDDKSKVSYVKFIVNEGYPQTKTFDNVEYSGDFTYDTNFNSIYFETKRQTSYELTDEDIDYREDTYKFCIPRNSLELNEVEQLANKSYKDRMKGKYLICHYKYDCNGGNTFKVPYISTAYRNSLI